MYDQFDPPDDGDIYARGRTYRFVPHGTKTVIVDGVAQLVDELVSVPKTEKALPLFLPEWSIRDSHDFTPAAIRSLFGPPLPAGVVCDEEVWAAPHVEHVLRAYVYPVAGLIQFDRDPYRYDEFREGAYVADEYLQPEYPSESTPLPTTDGDQT